jgi:carbamoyltransferase
MKVLGLSCFYHDAAAALLQDGRVVAAAQEERFSRKKHDPDYPVHAVKYVLKEAGISPTDLDAVAFYDKPLIKFERMLSTYIATFPRSFASFGSAMPVWMKEKLWVPSIIRRELKPRGLDIPRLALRRGRHLDGGRRRRVGHGLLWSRAWH